MNHKVIEAMRTIAREGTYEGPPESQLIEWAKLARAERLGVGTPHVYIAVPHHDGLDVVKIGWTGGPTDRRISEMQGSSPVRLGAGFVFPGPIALESAMHRRFATYRRRGEWFSVDGELGWFLGLSAASVLRRLENRSS